MCHYVNVGYSIEEECSLSSCPATLIAKNMDVHGSLQRLAASLSCTDTYVTLLASQSMSSVHFVVRRYFIVIRF